MYNLILVDLKKKLIYSFKSKNYIEIDLKYYIFIFLVFVHNLLFTST